MSRLEAAVKAWDHHWGDRYGDDAVEEMGEEVKIALDAADAHDGQNAIRRVSVSLESLSTVLQNTTLSPRELWDIIEAITVREGQ